MGPTAAAVAIEVALGLMLILLGRWGVRSAPTLAAQRTDPDDLPRLTASYRRGGLVCLGIGTMLILAGVSAGVLSAT